MNLETGREYRSTFGFYEYRARAYHPALGRFMSEDPKLFDAGDYNLFRYCHNDPLDMTDPTGLLGNIWWRNMTPEVYARMMSAVTREMLRNNLSAGAIGIGLAGYQAMNQLSATLAAIGQGAAQTPKSTSGYPESRANPNPKPPIVQSTADPDGHVHIDSGQRASFDQAYQIVRTNTDSREAIVGVTYNGTTRQYGVTPTLVRGSEFQGGQTGQLPPLPKGNYAYAGQVHSHTNRSGFSPYDIRWGNENHLPLVLYSANRGQMYVPLFTANPYSSSVQGAILPFGD